MGNKQKIRPPYYTYGDGARPCKSIHEFPPNKHIQPIDRNVPFNIWIIHIAQAFTRGDRTTVTI